MIELIERKTYPEDESLTLDFADKLTVANINVQFMHGPVCHFKMADENLIVNAKLSKFDNIDYALRAIINAKPLIVFLYNVIKTYDENGVSYTIRYNYIINDNSLSTLKEITNEIN